MIILSGMVAIYQGYFRIASFAIFKNIRTIIASPRLRTRQSQIKKNIKSLYWLISILNYCGNYKIILSKML